MIYTMSDFHLPSVKNVSMDKFGWGDHLLKIKEQWPLTDKDTIIIPGDISWALKPAEAVPDIDWLSSLPGKKVLMKGNHDLWWVSNKKMDSLLDGHVDITYLYNSSMEVEGITICGIRGWNIFSVDEKDITVRNRELLRLNMSLASTEATEPVVFMHFPPIIIGNDYESYHNALVSRGVKKVYYGHLHGDAAQYAFVGEKDGVTYQLVSADYLGFRPIAVL